MLVPLRAAGHGDVGLVAAEDKDAETVERKPSKAGCHLVKAFGLILQHTHHTRNTQSPLLLPSSCLSQQLFL